MMRKCICYTCGNSFAVDSEKVNGDPIICERCKGYCYFNDIRELEFEVLEVKDESQ